MSWNGVKSKLTNLFYKVQLKSGKPLMRRILPFGYILIAILFGLSSSLFLGLMFGTAVYYYVAAFIAVVPIFLYWCRRVAKLPIARRSKRMKRFLSKKSRVAVLLLLAATTLGGGIGIFTLVSGLTQTLYPEAHNVIWGTGYGFDQAWFTGDDGNVYDAYREAVLLGYSAEGLNSEAFREIAGTNTAGTLTDLWTYNDVYMSFDGADNSIAVQNLYYYPGSESFVYGDVVSGDYTNTSSDDDVFHGINEEDVGSAASETYWYTATAGADADDGSPDSNAEVDTGGAESNTYTNASANADIDDAIYDTWTENITDYSNFETIPDYLIVSIPSEDSYNLTIEAYITGDSEVINIRAWNFTTSGWDILGTLVNDTITEYELTSHHISSQEVNMSFIDNDASDVIVTTLYVDFVRIEGHTDLTPYELATVDEGHYPDYLIPGVIFGGDYTELQIDFTTSNLVSEDIYVQVYNATAAANQTVITIDSGTSTPMEYNLTAHQIDSGNVIVRFVDSNTTNDADQSTFSVDYARVYQFTAAVDADSARDNENIDKGGTGSYSNSGVVDGSEEELFEENFGTGGSDTYTNASANADIDDGIYDTWAENVTDYCNFETLINYEISSIPSETGYKLTVLAWITGDSEVINIRVWNYTSTGWDTLGVQVNNTKTNYTLTSHHISAQTVNMSFIDDDATDVIVTDLYVDLVNIWGHTDLDAYDMATVDDEHYPDYAISGIIAGKTFTELQLEVNVTDIGSEDIYLQVYNFTEAANQTQYTWASDTVSILEYNLSIHQISSGQVIIRVVDSDQSTDTLATVISFDFVRVYAFNATEQSDLPRDNENVDIGGSTDYGNSGAVDSSEETLFEENLGGPESNTYTNASANADLDDAVYDTWAENQTDFSNFETIPDYIITAIPAETEYNLTIDAYITGDSEVINIRAWNYTSSDWDIIGTLVNDTITEYVLDPTHHISGAEVNMSFIDNDLGDSVVTTLYVDFVRVDGHTDAVPYEFSPLPDYDVDGAADETYHFLEIDYTIVGDAEFIDVDIWNWTSSAWFDAGDINSGTSTPFNYTISDANGLLNGTRGCLVRFDDQDADASQTTLSIDYVRIHARTLPLTDFSFATVSDGHYPDYQVTGLPVGFDWYELQIEYNVTNIGSENVYIQVWDDPSNTTRGTITTNGIAVFEYNLTANERAGNDAIIRFVDSDQATDSVLTQLDIDYVRVYAYQEATFTQDYVDDEGTNIDGVGDIGTIVTFANMQTFGTTYATLTEANQGGDGANIEDFVDNEDSNVGAPTDLGTFDTFGNMQTYGTSYTTLTESDEGSAGSNTENNVDNDTSDQGAPTDVGTQGTFANAQSDPTGTSMTLQEENLGGVGVSEWQPVDGISTAETVWTTTGTSPYIDTQNEPTALIEVASTGSISSWYTFAATSGSGSGFTVNLSIYWQCASGDSYPEWGLDWTGDDVADASGSFTTQATYAWANIGTVTGLDTQAEIDACRVQFTHNKGGGGPDSVQIDAARLGISQAGGADYELDFEYQWTTLSPLDDTNEEVCIYINAAFPSENLDVDIWTGSWTNIDTITATGWHNTSIIAYLDNAQETIRLVDADKASETTQDTWNIGYIGIHTWTDATVNYRADQEVQWTTLDFDNTGGEELCIFMNATDAENIEVDIWDGSWINIISDLNSGAWNNISISAYLTATTETIRFVDATIAGDTASQDSWEINAVLIHTWNDAADWELNQEVHFGSIAFADDTEVIAIYANSTDAEDVLVHVWNGSWYSLWSDLTADAWNNLTVTDTITAADLYIRFLGGTETDDPTQSTWQINVLLIRTENASDSQTDYTAEGNAVADDGSWDHYSETQTTQVDSYTYTTEGNAISDNEVFDDYNEAGSSASDTTTYTAEGNAVSDNEVFDSYSEDAPEWDFDAPPVYYITSIPVETTYNVSIDWDDAVWGDTEIFYIQLWNFTDTAWTTIAQLDHTNSTPFLYENIDAKFISGGEVRVQFIDSALDTTQTTVKIDQIQVQGHTDAGPDWEIQIRQGYLDPTTNEVYNITILMRKEAAGENIYLQYSNNTDTWTTFATVSATSLTWYNATVVLNSTGDFEWRYLGVDETDDATNSSWFVDYAGIVLYNSSWSDTDYTAEGDAISDNGVWDEWIEIGVDLSDTYTYAVANADSEDAVTDDYSEDQAEYDFDFPPVYYITSIPVESTYNLTFDWDDTVWGDDEAILLLMWNFTYTEWTLIQWFTNASSTPFTENDFGSDLISGGEVRIRFEDSGVVDYIQTTLKVDLLQIQGHTSAGPDWEVQIRQGVFDPATNYDRYDLTVLMRKATSGENIYLYYQNDTDTWTLLTTVSAESLTWYNYTITLNSTGDAQWRWIGVDEVGDSTNSSWFVDYSGVLLHNDSIGDYDYTAEGDAGADDGSYDDWQETGIDLSDTTTYTTEGDAISDNGVYDSYAEDAPEYDFDFPPIYVIGSIPAEDVYNVTIDWDDAVWGDSEDFNIQMWNYTLTAWYTIAYFDETNSTPWLEYSFNTHLISGGEVQVRFIDTSLDTTQTTVKIDLIQIQGHTPSGTKYELTPIPTYEVDGATGETIYVVSIELRWTSAGGEDLAIDVWNFTSTAWEEQYTTQTASYAEFNTTISIANGLMNATYDCRIRVDDADKTTADTTQSTADVDYVRIWGHTDADPDYQLSMSYDITITNIQMDWYWINVSAYRLAGGDDFDVDADSVSVGTINSGSEQKIDVNVTTVATDGLITLKINDTIADDDINQTIYIDWVQVWGYNASRPDFDMEIIFEFNSTQLEADIVNIEIGDESNSTSGRTIQVEVKNDTDTSWHNIWNVTSDSEVQHYWNGSTYNDPAKILNSTTGFEIRYVYENFTSQTAITLDRLNSTITYDLGTDYRIQVEFNFTFTPNWGSITTFNLTDRSELDDGTIQVQVKNRTDDTWDNVFSVVETSETKHTQDMGPDGEDYVGVDDNVTIRYLGSQVSTDYGNITIDYMSLNLEYTLGDASPPSIVLDEPLNDTWSPCLQANLSITDPGGISQAYYKWSPYNEVLGDWTLFGAPYDIDTSGKGDGVFDLYVIANDSFGNPTDIFDSVEHYQLRIDNNAPDHGLVTPVNNTVVGGTIPWDFDPADGIGSGVDWMAIDDGSSNTTLSGPLYTNNMDSTGYSEGSKDFTIYLNDSAGIWNITIVSLIIDYSPPFVSDYDPANNSWVGGTYQNFMWDFDDTYATIDTLTSNWDDGVNTTRTDGVAWSENLFILFLDENGTQHFRMIFCNDTKGNEAYLNYTYNVDTVAPTVVLDTPGNGTTQGGMVWLNGTVGDLNLDTNYTLIWNSTWSLTVYQVDYELNTSEIGDGWYQWRIWANDTLTQSNSSTRWIYVDNEATTIRIDSYSYSETEQLYADVDQTITLVVRAVAGLQSEVDTVLIYYTTDSWDNNNTLILTQGDDSDPTTFVGTIEGKSADTTCYWFAYANVSNGNDARYPATVGLYESFTWISEPTSGGGGGGSLSPTMPEFILEYWSAVGAGPNIVFFWVLVVVGVLITVAFVRRYKLRGKKARVML